MTPSPHPVDVHVGARVRALRKSQRLSQAALAQAVGVSFQQLQKYERGANRLSASRLYDIAAALGAPAAYFYAGLPQQPAADAAPSSARLAHLRRLARTLAAELDDGA